MERRSGRACELSGFKTCKKKLIGPVMKLGKQLSSVISVKNLRSSWNYFSLKGAFIKGGGEINEIFVGSKACKNEIIGPPMKLGKQFALSFILKNPTSSYN